MRNILARGIIGLGLLVSSACAGIIYVDAAAPPPGDGQSWGTAFAYLQDALVVAQGRDELHIAGGSYAPDFDAQHAQGNGDRNSTFNLASGLVLLGGYAGRADPNDPDRRDLVQYPTTLRGDHCYHVLTATNTAAGTTLNGFIIRDGDGGGYFEYVIRNGAGLNVSGGTLAVQDCSFQNNVASSPVEVDFDGGSGGAVYCSQAQLDFVDTEFVNNSAGAGGGSGAGAGSGGNGGAICAVASSTLRLTGCTLTSNSAGNGGWGTSGAGVGPGGHGGSVFVDESSSLTATGCLISGNHAGGGGVGGYGGGIYVAGANATICRSAITANSAGDGVDDYSYYGGPGGPGGDGGGLYIAGGNASMRMCTISANSAGSGGDGGSVFGNGGNGGSGGGLFAATGLGIQIVGCLIADNQAGAGGESFTQPGIGGSGGNGGGVSLNAASATIGNCTFARNRAGTAGPGDYQAGNPGQGGAIGSTGSAPIVTNSILWLDIPDEALGQSAITYSDVAGHRPGPGNVSFDPRFVDPNAGDYHLAHFSRCIDAGDNTAVPGDLRMDLDGNLRFVDVPCRPDTGNGTVPIVDMGAYEASAEITDCNGNGIDDLCELLSGAGADCNGNQTLDECDIANGTSQDLDHDGIPDECERIHNVTRNAYFSRIRYALDAADDGDEVVAAPGTYHEAFKFNGKAVRLRSSDGPAATILDGSGLNVSIVTCDAGEGPGSILEGFTLTGGTGTPDPTGSTSGGAMFNVGSSPTVIQCVFSGNSAQGRSENWNGGGGAMYNAGSNPTIVRCTFRGNSVSGLEHVYGGGGGGMLNDGGGPTIVDCTFSGNWAAWCLGCGVGGAMWNRYGSSPTVINCTFSGNGSENGTITGSATLTNCVLWDDWGEIGGGAPTITYSDVRGGYAGNGNINADPLFVDAGNGNLRLSAGSPCIDAGTNNPAGGLPAHDADGNPRPVDGNGDGLAVADMGAYEYQPLGACCTNSACAIMTESVCTAGSGKWKGYGTVCAGDTCACRGDTNCDGLISFADINPFVQSLGSLSAWQTAHPGCPWQNCDVNSDGVVSFADINPFVAKLGNPGPCP